MVRISSLEEARTLTSELLILQSEPVFRTTDWKISQLPEYGDRRQNGVYLEDRFDDNRVLAKKDSISYCAVIATNSFERLRFSLSNANPKRRFCLVLIKPSHYDDDGYVIQWFRSGMPSNSLAVLYGLAQECGDQKTLGDDVEIEIHAFDETNTHIHPSRIASLNEKAHGAKLMLVGVP